MAGGRVPGPRGAGNAGRPVGGRGPSFESLKLLDSLRTARLLRLQAECYLQPQMGRVVLKNGLNGSTSLSKGGSPLRERQVVGGYAENVLELNHLTSMGLASEDGCNPSC